MRRLYMSRSVSLEQSASGQGNVNIAVPRGPTADDVPHYSLCRCNGNGGVKRRVQLGRANSN
jgi:hypothetical protein